MTSMSSYTMKGHHSSFKRFTEKKISCPAAYALTYQVTTTCTDNTTSTSSPGTFTF